MGKLKQNLLRELDLMNVGACLNGMVVTYEDYDMISCFVLREIDSDKVIASYSSQDKMEGFLDALDYKRTGKGPDY